MSASGTYRGYGFAVNVDDTPFPHELFDDLPLNDRRDILEEFIADEGEVSWGEKDDDYHPSDEFGMNGFVACIERTLKKDYPLLAVTLAGDDEDDAPWFVVYVKNTAQYSEGGIPFVCDCQDGGEHELNQLEEFRSTYFPEAKTDQLVWSCWMY
jgi:hypothetical protein